MKFTKTVQAVVVSIGLLFSSAAIRPAVQASGSASSIEAQAGTWRTWVLTSGSQFRLPPPPDQSATAGELDQLRKIAAQRDKATMERIAFWDVGAPGSQWNAILRDEFAKHGATTTSATQSRQLSLLDVAIYDVTVATWDSKYAYNRPRPAAIDATFATAVTTPASPSYPSEHAAVAGAAATVLTYLFPDDADALAAKADEAAQSRVEAGVQFPSDTAAGLDLGRNVARLVVERGKADGSAVPWDGNIPTGPGMWSLDGYPEGAVPVGPMFGTLRPWVLEAGSALRPGPPPAADSEQKLSELEEIKSFPRTFVTNSSAFYWQSPRADWIVLADDKIAQYHVDANPPRAARIDALLSIAAFDATVACWDAKYTYWAARPFQLDPDVRPLFPVPVHPSYPAAHGCVSGAQASVLGAMFPTEAQAFTNMADEAGLSRMWSGIHFRSDIDAGLVLGRAVAQRIIDRARGDGAEPP
jgi:membrane-associated phospholipid phosphatase